MQVYNKLQKKTTTKQNKQTNKKKPKQRKITYIFISEKLVYKLIHKPKKEYEKQIKWK